MGAKVRRVNNLDKIIKDVTQRKAMAAVASGLNIIGIAAAIKTPVGKTSVLINSQSQEVMANGTRITGRLVYSANYSVYVHEAKGALKGQPRPASQGGGNYWDPSGEPKFLEKAAEEERSKVLDAMKRELKL
ncbi:HK97 gp10 family phage protein [Klebsiella michiganensis]|uniref:HK97 gp10 family phage protein n=1 Tax=Klebsiella michiganensis TaxID=1134687 RepID=UPI0018C857CF|nr:HK97 gp10 family phage protein [Klebsiella michiganensis]MBG2548288.1 HK97 gp10 family phage protein [Klebsiella michiganensis]HEJ8217420.1 HK97 gp10 family phage protein [Klebsiella michiganensis]